MNAHQDDSINPMRQHRLIDSLFQQYLRLRQEVSNPEEWIRHYGYYLFRDQTRHDRWYGLLVGPEGSLWEGAMLLVRISFPTDLPFSPPKIENLLPFPLQFCDILWSADTLRCVVSSGSELRPHYGLISVDMLNTASFNNLDHPHRDRWSPIFLDGGLKTIMMSLRSYVFSEETRSRWMSDGEIKFSVFRYLTLGVLKHRYLLKPEDSLPKSELEAVLREVYTCYQSRYQEAIGELSVLGDLSCTETLELYFQLDIVKESLLVALTDPSHATTAEPLPRPDDAAAGDINAAVSFMLNKQEARRDLARFIANSPPLEISAE
jgi:ubiquitin-protein ligase